MIVDLLNLFADIVGILIAGGICIWIILFFWEQDCRKKKRKESLKQIENIKRKIKRIGKGVFLAFILLWKMFLCALLAIGIKPIIYRLNQPLGWGYATFASYCVAILLWVLLPSFKNVIEKGNKK